MKLARLFGGLLALSTAFTLASAQVTPQTPPPAAPGQYAPPLPQLDFMTRFTVALDTPPWELGATSAAGKRRIIAITGGTFDGPMLKGTIMNSGADWQVVAPDGTAVIDTRYLLKTDDGALIYLQTKGYRYGPPNVIADLAAGKNVDPKLYSFRITLTFETSDAKYAWLNRAIGIGYAIRQPKAVVYDAYLVK